MATPRLAAINVIVEREVLTARVNGLGPRGQLHTDWKWHSFQPDPVFTKLVGKVSAYRLSDGLIIWCNLVIYTDDAQSLKPTELFSLIDCQMGSAIDYILNYKKPHIPGQLCTENPFCEECYS